MEGRCLTDRLTDRRSHPGVPCRRLLISVHAQVDTTSLPLPEHSPGAPLPPNFFCTYSTGTVLGTGTWGRIDPVSPSRSSRQGFLGHSRTPWKEWPRFFLPEYSSVGCPADVKPIYFPRTPLSHSTPSSVSLMLQESFGEGREGASRSSAGLRFRTGWTWV